jgi:purine-binding chemotaxis protein CheW
MTTDTLEQQADQASLSEDGFEELASDTRQFVTFIADNEVFAVDMAPVQEIIRLPEVVRVPLAPPTLDGLANLRGKVLPIVSLRRLFGFAERVHDDSTRAVVIDVGQPLGFVVDQVSSVVEVNINQIEDVDAIRSTVDSDLLTGIINNVGGHSMIMVLDFEKLIHREFAQIAALAKTSNLAANLAIDNNSADSDEQDSDELQLVSFDVAGQEYAISIDDVQEIIQVPDTVVHVPHSAPHVLGLITLRSRLLPLVDLRRLFDLSDRDLDEKSRIVVLSLGGAEVGLAVDAVSEVLRVPKNLVDPMPVLLASEGNLADIAEICRLDDGKRLVSIVTARNLFDHSAIKEALNTVSDSYQDIDNNAELDDSVDDEEQVVVFHLGKEEFGVEINNVQEIVRVPDELIHVPKAPGSVEGVINLRGTVLPVIDLRARLGLEKLARTDRQRIMVFMIAEVRTGFIVDHVAEVLKIPKSLIEPSPQLSSEQGRLLARMANMEKQKRMVQLIETAYLIDSDELSKISSGEWETV